MSVGQKGSQTQSRVSKNMGMEVKQKMRTMAAGTEVYDEDAGWTDGGG